MVQCTNITSGAFLLGDWAVYPDSNELVMRDRRVKLETKVMEALVYLCKNSERVISKEELIDSVWGQAPLSPNLINVAIRSIRKALDDDAKQPKYLETIRKRGYRLLVPVQKLSTTSNHFELPALSFTSAVICVLALVCFIVFSIATPNQPPSSEQVVVAMTGIENATGDPGNDEFAENLADLFIAELAQHQKVEVRKGDAEKEWLANGYRQADITGKLMANDGEFHLTLYLTDLNSRKVLWARSERVDRQHYLADAHTSTQSLLQSLESDEGIQTQSEVDALYQRALDFAEIRSNVTAKAAHSQAQAVLKIDPNHGPAYVLLARLYKQYGEPGFWDAEGDPRALGDQALHFARQYGADEAEILMLESYDLLSFPNQFPEARKKATRALELGTENAWVYRFSVWPEMLYGNFDEALARNKRALELSVDPSSALSERIVPLYFSGRFQEANELYDLIRQQNILPVYYGPQSAIIVGDQATGFARWVDFIRQHQIHIPDESGAMEWVQNGEIARAYDWLRSYTGEYSQRLSYPLTLSSWHLAAGDVDMAINTLLDASSHGEGLNRSVFWNWLQYDPYYNSVKNDPRWHAIFKNAEVSLAPDFND